MKSETQIAKENVELVKKHNLDKDTKDNICITHLESCKRFLEFLEEIEKEYNLPPLNKKVELREVIKIYNGVGIQ